MLDLKPLTRQEQEFIKENAQADPAKLILQGHRYGDLNISKLVHYIQARQKIKDKLPEWYENLNIFYPPALSLEQSSSKITAAFKAGLVNGNLLVDLTGGFGIDSFYFARKIKEVIYVERQAELTQIAAHNAGELGVGNIVFRTADAQTFLNAFSGTADWIYLDPARRDNVNRKVHLLEDCEPDVLQLLPLLLAKGKNILLKTSPMLDIHQALRQLQKVHNIYVVAVENECKEVLYHLTAAPDSYPEIAAVNLLPETTTQHFTFNALTEETAQVNYSLPQTYIYEPNAAILKAGGYRSLAQKYHLSKLHRNSHVYTSTALIKEFPGRIFLLKATSRYQKKELLLHLPKKKANITVRNFPETVAAIRTKTGIKEGGNIYLFATTDLNQKPIILICEKP